MSLIYPECEPIHEQFLAVSDLHTVHYEVCGNPKGKPVLFVHGGPGGGIDPYYRRMFHPEHYYVVLVNQRGSGKSTPHAELKENTTQHLIDDFERIREACGIDQWLVFGGSWGSTLGLAYAEAHPERVTELVLRGIYLATDEENQWLFGGCGANKVFPDYWEKFIGIIPEEERDDLLAAYHRRLTSDDAAVVEEAARAWSGWEFSISTLRPDADGCADYLESPAMTSLARLECHYMANGCFFKPNQLLDDLHKIKHIPCYIVHGRYDMVCAAQTAWRLHAHWPASHLTFVTEAGHSLKDPQLAAELVAILNRLVGVVD